MSTNTKNLKLIQQESHEYYDLNITNENLDIIDSEIGEKLNSPNLLNPNITNFEVGVGTVEETLKYYTEQMKQSIVTIDNIQGNTRKIGEVLNGVNLSRIIKVENENSTINLLKGKPTVIGIDYGNRKKGTYFLDMCINRYTRISYLELIDVIPGNQYTIKNFSSDNMIFIAHYYDEYGCKIIDGDVDWGTTLNVHTFTAPMGCYKVMIFGKKSDNSYIESSTLESLQLMFVHGTEPTSYIESDYKSNVYEYENIKLHKASATGIFDEIKEGKLIKRLDELNTGITSFDVKDFSISGDYGRIEVTLPNAIVYTSQHIICNTLPVYRYNSNTAKWLTPDENCIILNKTDTDKSRIYFVIKNQKTQDNILNYIKQAEMQIVYQRMNPLIEDINLSLVVNKDEKIKMVTPVDSSCTHKVSLNTKAQLEELQDFAIKEKKSIFEKIKKLTDVSMNLGPTGYIKLPTILGGIIFQWGIGTFTTNNTAGLFDTKIIFPITFENKCCACLSSLDKLGDNGWGDIDNYISHAYGISVTNVNIRGKSIVTTTTGKTGTFRWLAIGY